MDVRGLVAGCHVSAEKLAGVVASLGHDEFVTTTAALCDSAERVLRDRIGRLADGTYSTDGWVEWGEELYHLPCTLTVADDSLQFDFTGAPPQVPHFINSKHYLVEGEVVADVRANLAQDLPFCEGIYRAIDVVCPPGTIVDSAPPAPIASAHLDVAMNATALAVQCLQLALAATDDDTLPRLYAGPSGQAALATHSWSYTTPEGAIDGWVLSESFQPGSSGGTGHDGSDLFANLVGAQHVLDFVDIEITEAWYPMHVLEKRAAPGTHGAGRHRSGSGCRMAYRVSGDEHLTGAMFAMREALPIGGVAGGFPGAPTEFRIRRADGSDEALAAHAGGIALGTGRRVRVPRRVGRRLGRPARARSGGGRRRRARGAAFARGGPRGLRRGHPAAVAAPRRRSRSARHGTAAGRPPPHPARHGGPAAAPADPGGGHRGRRPRRRRPAALPRCRAARGLRGRRRQRRGARRRPRHWTDGCRVLGEARTSPSGAPWFQRTYLDPLSGVALFVEAVPPGTGRSFTTAPRHWVDAAAESAPGR